MLLEPRSSATGEFLDAMSTLASGVALVTCLVDDRPWGVTVTSFASVSAAPPTVLVSLCSEGVAARAIGETRRFGVSILADDQVEIARFGSASGEVKFLEAFVDSYEWRSASPVVVGGLAHLDCEVTRELHVADHTIFIGRVWGAQASEEGGPLLHHRREYL